VNNLPPGVDGAAAFNLGLNIRLHVFLGGVKLGGGGLRGGGINIVRFGGFALRRFKCGFRFAQYFASVRKRLALKERVTGGADFGLRYGGAGKAKGHRFTAPGKAGAGGAAAGKRGLKSRQAGAPRGRKAVQHRIKGNHRKPQASGKRGKRG
jgi:hypothetical protein